MSEPTSVPDGGAVRIPKDTAVWTMPSKEAVEYGRKVVAPLIEKYRRWEMKAQAKGDERQMLSWRRMANMLVRDLYGYDDGGCVIVAFDQRWLDDDFRKMMAETVPAGLAKKAERERAGG